MPSLVHPRVTGFIADASRSNTPPLKWISHRCFEVMRDENAREEEESEAAATEDTAVNAAAREGRA